VRIIGLDNMSYGALAEDVGKGGRFVIFQYAISLLVVSFKKPTSIYYIPAGQGTFVKSLGASATSFFLGWWGFPFGLIFTIESLIINMRGGRDVTGDVMASIGADLAAQYGSPSAKPWEQNGSSANPWKRPPARDERDDRGAQFGGGPPGKQWERGGA
jgi:hypothetical protein